MRVLMCGDRDWHDPWPISVLLLGMAIREHGLTVIEGEARGADSTARMLAEAHRESLSGLGVDVSVEPYPADWQTHGKAAGPIRNQQMLDEGKPDVVVAFHDDVASSRGTADMVRRAKKAGLPVYVVGRA